jgi:hypothetical protein
MSDDPLPDWYIRKVALRALQDPPAVEWPADDPGNIFSIEAARTRRATRQMMRQRGL